MNYFYDWSLLLKHYFITLNLNLQNQPRVLDTPLTGRSFLGPRDSDGRSVTERVSRLHAYLRNRKAGPSDQLKAIFE